MVFDCLFAVLYIGPMQPAVVGLRTPNSAGYPKCSTLQDTLENAMPIYQFGHRNCCVAFAWCDRALS